jgi:hypothetical protein
VPRVFRALADLAAGVLVAGAAWELRPLLRDGETVETVASADPVTGEMVKVSVSMEVVK